ncbi:MAG: hypothetical protein R6V83_08525 [Candidatus Thorarchaeota archaeon]
MFSIPPTQKASADIIVSSEGDGGLPYPLLTNASMPEADVEINMSCTRTAPKQVRYDINMTASFLVFSPYSQNATIAFVLPSPPLGPSTTTDECSADVLVDEKDLDFERVEWEQLNVS